MRVSQPTPSNIVTAQLADQAVTLSKSKTARCLVKRTAVQSIPNNTFTLITWTDEVFDTESIHDPAVNPTRLTVPSGYTLALVGFGVRWSANAAGIRVARLFKNASDVNPLIQAVEASPTAAFTAYTDHSGIVVPVVAGDFFTLTVQQTSGAALDASVIDGEPWMSLILWG